MTIHSARWLTLALLSAGSLTVQSAAPTVMLSVREEIGVARTNAPVTSGVPFPMGALPTNLPVSLVGPGGQELPLQSRVLNTWRDGSVRWLLVDFQTDLQPGESRQFQLRPEQGLPANPFPRAMRIQDNPGGLAIDSGRLWFECGRNATALGNLVNLGLSSGLEVNPGRACGGVQASMLVSSPIRRSLRAMPPEAIAIEDRGPLRSVVKLSGWFADPAKPEPFPSMKYVLRLTSFAGLPRVKLEFTVTHLGSPGQFMVDQYGLSMIMARENSPTAEAELQQWQLEENRYQVIGPNIQTNGLRAPGWATWQDEHLRAALGVRHFWEQFPAAFRVGPQRIGVDLYRAIPGKPLDWDQGLAKTHELWLELEKAPALPVATATTGSPQRSMQTVGEGLPAQAKLLVSPASDLFAFASPQWYCDSGVFGDLLPFDFDLFPDYETLTEASGDQFAKKMATGWRNWGDCYYGGEYKGTNSYLNLEYDVHHNCLLQFARTGLRKYFELARVMARHQGDIDTNHKTGWQWKHSPRHVEIQAEFGHTFTRGLLETYAMTGDRRHLEAAIELGDYFARAIRNPRELGNERQIGWSLLSLLPVYEMTWDKKYFEAARDTVDRLLGGLEPTGKFKIRWDNRIAFFNGIAASGLLAYHRATGDPRVAGAALKVITRTMGFYPEYNGRTLEAIAWAFQHTGHSNYLDLLQRTWETTLARQVGWNSMELGAPTIFTVHALPFLARSSFIRPPEFPLRLSAAEMASENGLHAHHLPAGEGELWLQGGTEPFELIVVRKGAWKSEGTATLYDASGVTVSRLEFPRENTVWQRKSFHVAPKGASSSGSIIPSPGAWRLALRSPSPTNVRGGSYVTWDLVTSRPVPAVFRTTSHSGLEFVTPALFTLPSPGAAKIELDLAAEGEGFKKVTVRDPEGRVGGSMQAFIDLGDKSRYQYRLTVPVPSGQQDQVWSVILQDMSVQKISGLLPYFATSRAAFFRPGQY